MSATTAATWNGILLLAAIAASGLPMSAAAQSAFPSRLDRLPPGLLTEPDQSRELPPAGVEVRRVSDAGLTLTKDSEGWSAKLYDDSAGFCTIGYGHLIKKARCNGTELKEFLQGIEKPRGTEILVQDMARAQITVMLAVEKELEDNQYAALVDFVFNVGATNFRKSTLLQRINDGRFDDVPAQLGRWTMAGGKVFMGLVNRRKAETALFFKGQSIPRPVPSQDDDLSPLDIMRGETKKE